METNVRTPIDIFHLPQHLVVPIFQRPYVWDETDQWVPLWQHVRRIAELRLADGYSQATHFLGAVVLQAQENSTGVMQSRNIIDGQQRITTLSLLMDACGAVLESSGYEKLAGQLEDLTHNSDRHVRQDEDLLKLRHTNRDRAAYDEVMRADPPIDYATLANASSLKVRAHAYFTAAVTEWLQDPSAAEEHEARADALVDVLTRGLQLVAIDLRSTENSQEIFETLNARGTPLTAADLIKNFVFQTLQAEGADTQRAYSEDWPFEAKFWEEEVSVGRYLVSRGSLFLNQWLIARTGEEVGPKRPSQDSSTLSNISPVRRWLTSCLLSRRRQSFMSSGTDGLRTAIATSTPLRCVYTEAQPQDSNSSSLRLFGCTSLRHHSHQTSSMGSSPPSKAGSSGACCSGSPVPT